jgi:RNA polymerase sigma-B factor
MHGLTAEVLEQRVPRSEGGRRSARDRAIEENLALVTSLARHFAHRGEGLDDLVQVGAIGLINAVDRYDARLGVDLRAYAVPTIVGEMKRHLRDHATTIRVPRRDQEARSALRRTRRELAERFLHVPTWSELAVSSSLSDDEFMRAVKAERATTPLPLSVLATTEADGAEDDGFAAGEDRELVREGLEALDPRERRVLRLTYFDGLSQREVADRLDISQSHVSRLVTGALEKMRAALGADGRVGNRGG